METIHTVEEIYEEAVEVAKIYDPRRCWKDWSLNARDDFWSIAQDLLEIPAPQRIDMPDVYLNDS